MTQSNYNKIVGKRLQHLIDREKKICGRIDTYYEAKNLIKNKITLLEDSISSTSNEINKLKLRLTHNSEEDQISVNKVKIRLDYKIDQLHQKLEIFQLNLKNIDSSISYYTSLKITMSAELEKENTLMSKLLEKYRNEKQFNYDAGKEVEFDLLFHLSLLFSRSLQFLQTFSYLNYSNQNQNQIQNQIQI